MRAAVVPHYGPPSVVVVAERPDPAPRAQQLLVRVEAAAVSSGDARIRGARFPAGFGIPARAAFGIRGPRQPVLGSAFAGVVVARGAGVAGPAVGDRVAGMNGARLGAHAELIAVEATRVVPIPDRVSSAEAAAALFGGTTALYFLRDRAALRAGESVLVTGASGSVGSAAVQLARREGARVTGVTSARNADLVRRLGAERTIDHTTTSLSDVPDRFDVVLDAVGSLDTRSGQRLLTERGRLLLVAAGLGDTLRARGRIHAGPTPERADDLDLLLTLVAAGEFDPLTDEIGGLDAVVAAYERIDSGRKVGNLVIDPRRGFAGDPADRA